MRDWPRTCVPPEFPILAQRGSAPVNAGFVCARHGPRSRTLHANLRRARWGHLSPVGDLSFRVDAGEVVGMIGPNGAGKTTTLRALAGILRPTSGRVTIDGHDIVTDAIAAKRHLAFMPDEPHLFEYLTVEEHLRL